MEFYSNFKIIGFQELESRFLLSRPGTRLQGPEYENTIPAESIYYFLKEKHGAKTILMEEEYVDLDFLDEYRGFYSRKFDKHKKYCSRFHFFSQEITVEDLPNLEKFKEYYLGYVIVRPLSAFIIGRTVLSPKVLDQDNYFVLCQDDFTPNIAGHELNVKGVAFLQQDTQVGCCATASLWMATKVLSRKFEFRSYSPAEITTMATKYDVRLGRPIPSEGLAVGQMCSALREMGYEPKLHLPKSKTNAKEIIYLYVESQFPVLLAIHQPDKPEDEGHVITVIGHTYRCPTDPTMFGLDKSEPSVGDYTLSSQWVDKFIVHDDRIGPYIELEMCDSKQEYSEPVKLRTDSEVLECKQIYEYPCPVQIKYEDKGKVKSEIWNLDVIIVPLPPGIYSTAEHVEKKAKRFLSMVKKHAIEPYASQLKGVVIRCYLCRSNEFKKNRPEKMVVDLKCYYRGKPLPKYLWVVELSRKEWMNEKRKEARIMMGEILIDATSSSFEHGIISAHLPGVLIDKYSSHIWGKSEFVPISDDTEYPHLAR